MISREIIQGILLFNAGQGVSFVIGLTVLVQIESKDECVSDLLHHSIALRNLFFPFTHHVVFSYP